MAGFLKKGFLNLGEEAAESAAKDAARTLASKSAKEFAEEGSSAFAKQVGSTAASRAAASTTRDSFAKIFLKAGPDVVKAGTVNSAKKFASKAFSLKNVILIGVAAGGAYMVIDPLVSYNKKNGSTYTVINVQDVSIQTGVVGDTLITYTPGVALYDGVVASTPSPDNLSFSGITSTPSINNKPYPVKSVVDQLNVIINIGTSAISELKLLLKEFDKQVGK